MESLDYDPRTVGDSGVLDYSITVQVLHTRNARKPQYYPRECKTVGSLVRPRAAKSLEAAYYAFKIPILVNSVARQEVLMGSQQIEMSDR